MRLRPRFLTFLPQVFQGTENQTPSIFSDLKTIYLQIKTDTIYDAKSNIPEQSTQYQNGLDHQSILWMAEPTQTIKECIHMQTQKSLTCSRQCFCVPVWPSGKGH